MTKTILDKIMNIISIELENINWGLLESFIVKATSFSTLFYRYVQNFWVTERFYSKIATFEWPFSRTLSGAIKARLTPKDAEFCQIYFSHQSFYGVRFVFEYKQSSKKRQKNALKHYIKEKVFCRFLSRKTRERNLKPIKGWCEK